MKMNKIAFSLVEIVIATSIITISVFGVYKLIGENTKIINNSGNTIQLKSLFSTVESCVDNIGLNTFLISSTGTYNFNYGLMLDECNTGSISSGVTLDNIEYNIKGNITDSGSNYINWEFLISSDETKVLTGYYIQK